MEKQFLTDLGVADDIADQIITQASAEAKAAADETAGIQAQLEDFNSHARVGRDGGKKEVI